MKFWGWQCLNLAISVYSKFCHTDITKTFLLLPLCGLWVLCWPSALVFVDRGSWAEYALVLGKVLYWRPYLDILYPSWKVLCPQNDGLCPLCPQSGGYPLIWFASSLSGETGNYCWEFLAPLMTDDKQLQQSDLWGPLLLLLFSLVLLLFLLSLWLLFFLLFFFSLSLSFGPAPLLTLPSVIYSLFSFYLLSAWTPVPDVL